MTNPNSHLETDKSPSNFHLLVDFVKSRFLSIFLVAGVIIGLLSVFGFEITVPRSGKLALLTFVALAPYGYMFGKYVTSILYNPEHIFLVDLDARHVDGALYQFPISKFRELDIQDGDLCRLTSHLYTGKDLNPEELTVKGTWRGSLDDRELLRELSKVDECRNILEKDAKRGFAIETQAFTIIRSATREAVMSVIQTFEDGTLPDEGDGINNAVDRAVARYDIEDRLTRTTKNEQVTPDELEDMEKPETETNGDSQSSVDHEFTVNVEGETNE